MGVYIPNMEMPKNCTFCEMWHNIDCHPYQGISPPKSRPDHCPLVEVHDHGRLVDATEMFEYFVIEGQRSKRYKLGEKWELNGEEIRKVIAELPTVIPASEKE